jgi:hypothetical protein
MSKQMPKILASAVLALLPVASSYALPIDWHGTFGVDSTLISDYRRLKSKDVTPTIDTGSQETGLDTGNKSSASWQSYVFRLSPTMVINDAATFFGELTTGYANGGFLGDSPAVDSGTNGASAGTFGGPLAYYQQSRGSGVNVKKAYIELYSDTATYQIGRHSTEWALGAIYNDGSDTWDRHASTRDGITMKLKIGNFHVSPFWSKVANPGYTDATNTKEFGASVLYDNPERDIAFGILYNKRNSSGASTAYNTSMNGSAVSLGENSITVTDLYFKKTFGRIDVAAEVPLLSGDLGKTDATSNVTSYSAKAFLLQTNFKWTDAWTVGVDAGKVSGHDGSTSKYSALYLNPNYQVANLLFRYNVAAIGDKTHGTSVYDSYITNARYLKLKSIYSTEKWVFDTSLIMAWADKTASAGSKAYNHATDRMFNAIADQSNKLGTELDINAKYHWNKEISIGMGVGYLFTGDYFGYTNTATPNTVSNSLLLQINTAVTF